MNISSQWSVVSRQWFRFLQLTTDSGQLTRIWQLVEIEIYEATDHYAGDQKEENEATSWAAFFLALKWIGGFEHDVLDSLPQTYIAAFSKCGHGALMHFLLRDEPLHDYRTKVAVTGPFWSRQN